MTNEQGQMFSVLIQTNHAARAVLELSTVADNIYRSPKFYDVKRSEDVEMKQTMLILSAGDLLRINSLISIIYGRFALKA